MTKPKAEIFILGLIPLIGTVILLWLAFVLSAPSNPPSASSAREVATQAPPRALEPLKRRTERDGLSSAEFARLHNAVLAYVGPGSIAVAERSPDPGEAYEVEVLVGDREVDVALDRQFERVTNRSPEN